MSIVVVGTDTDVGKTLVSASILARYARSVRLAYWKPVATGGQDGDTASVERWVGDRVDVLPSTYSFEPPVSPHLAARKAKVAIEPDRICAELVEHGLAHEDRSLVIEGIGGVLVPLNDHGYLWVHLMRDMCLPCVLVARSIVGTINHTLLSLAALRKERVEVAGVILSGPKNKDNKEAIERFGDVPVLAELDRIPRVGKKGLADAAKKFDRRARLRSLLV
ncbi:MAG: dethiobiotin synthase [Planctomycetota bacterium]